MLFVFNCLSKFEERFHICTQVFRAGQWSLEFYNEIDLKFEKKFYDCFLRWLSTSGNLLRYIPTVLKILLHDGYHLSGLIEMMTNLFTD